MINRKRKGTEYERKVANEWRAKGCYVMRSAASLGIADLIIVDPNKSLILLTQCKHPDIKMSVTAKYKALLPLKALEGYYKVEALLV